MLPWLVADVEDAVREMGEDWWPYGFHGNRHVLDTFLRYHHEQGLSKRRLAAGGDVRAGDAGGFQDLARWQAPTASCSPASWAGPSRIRARRCCTTTGCGKYDLAGTYVPLAIRPEGLAAALRALHPLGFAGCNLTLPLKQHAMTIVDEVDTTARRIGAISCVVVRPDGTLAGTNNDWYGFVHNLKQEQPGWRADAGPVAVLGAGGGSRAVCYGLLQEGAREIRLVNRTFARAKAIADEFGGPITPLPWEQRHDALEGAAMAVNATSQGMVGQPALDIDLDKLPQDRARRRHHLHAARDAVSRGGESARQPDHQRPRHAAAPGPAGVEALVRDRARGHGRAALADGAQL